MAAVLERTGSLCLPASAATTDAGEWAMASTPAGRRLLVVPAAAHMELLADFEGERGEHGGAPFLVGPPTAANAAALRRHLRWL